MEKNEKYYNILGLRNGASQIEIKNAYKNLALIYHPDKETGSNKKFLEIKEAYGILFNKELYEKEMNELKKDPKEYNRKRALYPIVFEDEKNTGNSKTNKPVPYKQKNTPPKPKKPTTTSVQKKNNDGGGFLVPFCIGGIVVFAILSILNIPGIIFLIIIAVVAYYILK